jgi:hypothetical protein
MKSKSYSASKSDFIKDKQLFKDNPNSRHKADGPLWFYGYTLTYSPRGRPAFSPSNLQPKMEKKDRR